MPENLHFWSARMSNINSTIFKIRTQKKILRAVFFVFLQKNSLKNQAKNTYRMFDVIIVGGGLAGLVNAIRLGRRGFRVAVFEKNTYPFHKVCGEYISNETLDFFHNDLKINPFDYGAVALNEFRLTSPQGNAFTVGLELGGFGISRYTLDHVLFEHAQKLGVRFFLSTKITEIGQENTGYFVRTSKLEKYNSRILIGAYGKRSHLDKKLRRKFFQKRSPYVGVKYHIRTDLHSDTQIALHNFVDGYCGISRIEAGKYCLCYLTTRQNLRKTGTIQNLENQVLKRNPFLKELFERSEFLYEKPAVINEISFAAKTQTENGILMCGDSAGMITPLCGNGMSMAIHGAKIMSDFVPLFLENQISEHELHQNYTKMWHHFFASRLRFGRIIQQYFGDPFLSEVLVKTAQKIPSFARLLVRLSHGKSF